MEDLRVYPTASSQAYIDSALSVRAKSAELLFVDVNVEAITFNNGYYTVDITYYYRITGETSPGGNTVTGLAIFTKRVMLCGGVGTVKTFSSDPMATLGEADGLPIATVEAVDPIALHLKLVDTAQCVCPPDQVQPDIPAYIQSRFGDSLLVAEPSRGFTSPSASSPSYAWSATPSCSSPPTTTVSPTRSARRELPGRPLPPYSPTSSSLWRSSSPRTASEKAGRPRLPGAAQAV